MIVAIAKCCVS